MMELSDQKGEFARNWRLLIASIAGCGFCIAGLATYSIGPFVNTSSRCQRQ